MKHLSNINRLLLHIPVGVVIALAFWVNPWFGLGLLALFIFYESNEDHHINDQAWKDVAGACWGMAIAAIIWAGWRLLL